MWKTISTYLCSSSFLWQCVTGATASTLFVWKKSGTKYISQQIMTFFFYFSHLKKRIFPLLCDKINQFPPKSHKLPSSIFLVHKLLFPWTFFFAFLLLFAIWMCVYMCMWILPLKKHQPWKPVVQVFHQF